MLSLEKVKSLQSRTVEILRQTGIAITPDEAGRIEVADFGLGDVENLGLELLTYVNTERVCAKELVLLPGQTCPEHLHPPVADGPGKEETFRCRQGEVYLYVPGEPAQRPKASVPGDHAEHFTVWHELILHPGEQYTLVPNTRHWFQAGPQGAVVSEFSTRSRDESDIFTDPRIVRETKVGG